MIFGYTWKMIFMMKNTVRSDLHKQEDVYPAGGFLELKKVGLSQLLADFFCIFLLSIK